jgi:nucleosome binding factor SPN SPT16 subunit
VYEKIVAFVKKEKPDMVEKLTKLFGFVMGVEFREGSMLIGPKCTAEVEKGMTFNIHIGLSDLKNDSSTDDAGKKYALFLGDTVIVNEVCIFILLKYCKS